MPDLAPGFTCRPSNLITLFGVLSAYRGFSVLFVQPLSRLTSSGQGELLKEGFSFDVSTRRDPRVLFVQFVQPLLQPVLSDPGELITAGVCFDVSNPVLSRWGDSVCPRRHWLVSDNAGGWDRLLVTTYVCTLSGGPVSCGWLHSVARGVWLMAPPISMDLCTAAIGCGCIWIVYACQRSLSAADGFTGAQDSGVLADGCLFLLAANLSDCSRVIACFIMLA